MSWCAPARGAGRSGWQPSYRGDVRVKTLFLIFEAAFALLKAALFPPARILGYRPRPLGRRP
jgi:hypothetical protein